MYKEMTFSKILNRMLEKVPNTFDKRQGSIIYDALAPICVEFAQMYISLENILKQGFADTADREFLIKRAYERGLIPYPATNAILLAEFSGDINMKGGERFRLDDLIYFYMGEKEDNYYKLKCEETGTKGNIGYGELLPIENVEGLLKAVVVQIFNSARDEENTEDFRNRYFESFKNQAFGGNKADYKEKMKELNKIQKIVDNGGIGGCKIYRIKELGGRIKIHFINSNFNIPTENLLKLVQEEIDPIELSGEGVGIAPIGHFVTLFPANSVIINIDTQIDFKDGYSLEDVNAYIEIEIEKYINQIGKTWENENSLVVRISHIESILLDISGIQDVSNTRINSVGENIILDEFSIPLRGYINVN